MSSLSAFANSTSWTWSLAKLYRSSRMLPYSAEFHLVHEDYAFHGFPTNKFTRQGLNNRLNAVLGIRLMMNLYNLENPELQAMTETVKKHTLSSVL